MFELEMQAVSAEFEACFLAAGGHLQVLGNRAGGFVWLKAELSPPFLEHLSFRLGNQVFFVRLEEPRGSLRVPGSRMGLGTIADGWNGHACLLPMRRTGGRWSFGRQSDGAWEPELSGWGLVGAADGRAIHPPALVTDGQIEMSDWELHDFAVQVVRDTLVREGRELMSSQGNPLVDPSIWFVGDHGPEWIVVRGCRYPAREARLPANWEAIRQSCQRLSDIGHFASVAIASADEPSNPTGEPIPLWRGTGMHVRYAGLARVGGQ